MIDLTREVRFFLEESDADAVSNSWSAWPMLCDRLAPFLIFRCTLRGEISPETDYLCNVKDVDRILRTFIIELNKQNPNAARRIPIAVLRDAWNFSRDHTPARTRLSKLQLLLSPFLCFTMDERDPSMIHLSQQYEFSASHRLHNHQLSDEANRQFYGKCNNPHGHGHNYVLEVTWKLDAKGESTRPTGLANLDRVVKSIVIDRLDHRYLNVEVPPFDRLNPTAENIAVTIWGWLADQFPPAAVLSNIRIYETPKTWADYAGR